MHRYILRLLEDQPQTGVISAAALAAEHRVIYVVEGEAAIAAAGEVTTVAAHAAWYGSGACTITCGTPEVRLLRWELVRLFGQHPGVLTAEGWGSTEKLSHEIELNPVQQYLIRCDRVDFPAGGIAYTHTHQGPGIRCVLFGEFSVRVDGTQHHVEAGGAWFERGPEPVYAAASQAGPAAFVRVMVLPRVLLGKSSIRYVQPEEQDKPKPQRYTMLADVGIDL
jgi:quercetin dioxygenase-like cupin family protein